jgi:hypothetical protein
MWWNVLMYENGKKMRPVEPIPGMGGREYYTQKRKKNISH